MPTLPNYSVARSKRRSLALHIDKNGTLIVKAPHLIPKLFIDQFVAQHLDWIDKHTKTVRIAKVAQKEGEYLYLGQNVTLTPGDYSEIRVVGDKLLFPRALLFRRDKEIHQWYIREARRIITFQLEKFAREMNAEYKEITFSDTTSQWGRCTSDNRLQFSWRLVMAPILTLNYVVIHELAHTLEKNHSRAFWSIVRKYTPSYRQQIKWLTEHGRHMHMVSD